MPELRVINTLNARRQEIEARFGRLEQVIEQAGRQLPAVLSSITALSVKGSKVTAKPFPRHKLPELASAHVPALAGRKDDAAHMMRLAVALPEDAAVKDDLVERQAELERRNSR